MGSVADWLIDHFTGEAIKGKMVEERNSGRASGSGEFGADLWVEAMVRTVEKHSSCILSFVWRRFCCHHISGWFLAIVNAYTKYVSKKGTEVYKGLYIFFIPGIWAFCVMPSRWRCLTG